MSEENVEIVRQIVTLNNDRDIEGVLELMDPDVECFPAEDQPESKGFQGREAFAAYAKEWLETFVEYAIEPIEFLDLDDSVILVGRVVGRGRKSQAVVSDEEAWLYRFREGKIVQYRECGTKAQALEAAGMRE
jgi:ketosteroid isomerase-like protein